MISSLFFRKKAFVLLSFTPDSCISTSKLFKQTGLSKTFIFETLSTFISLGYVTRVTKGNYQLTKKGYDLKCIFEKIN